MLTNLRHLVEAEFDRTGSRRTIALTDGTLRDAHQCLWATRMRTEHMLPIASRIADAGFGAVEAIAMVGFDAGVLFLNQDPFERVRLLADRVTTAPLRAAVRSNLLHGFYPQPDDINELFVERMFVNGIRDFAVLDSLHSWDNVAPGIRIAKRLGAKVTIALVFNLAPGYDDDFYVRQAREVIDRFGVDTISLADAGGSLTVERTRTLVPALRAAIGDTRLELNTHCLTGMGPQVALEAAVYGADQILTAVDPLANGNPVAVGSGDGPGSACPGVRRRRRRPITRRGRRVSGQARRATGLPCRSPRGVRPRQLPDAVRRWRHDESRGTAEGRGNCRQTAGGDRGDRPGP